MRTTIRYALLFLAALTTGVANAQPAPVTVLFGSDPQFTWWRGGQDALCNSADCEQQKTVQYNIDMINAMNQAGNLSWMNRYNLTTGAGPVHPPSAVIMNGDLTAYFQQADFNLYKQYFTGYGLQFPLYPGLGNHDYANNRNNCYYDGSFDPNKCTKEAIWYMANLIDAGLPNQVNKDISGFVSVQNQAGFFTQVSLTYDGLATPLQTDVFAGTGQWRTLTVPHTATNIWVNIFAFNGFSWVTAGQYFLPTASRACYGVTGVAWSPQTSTTSCQDPWPSGTYGSLSYSFDIGNYHFVQLQLSPDYETEVPSGVAFGGPTPSFSVRNSWDWLKKDLDAATAAGKYSVLNMHAFGMSTKNPSDTLKLDALGDFPINRDKLVATLTGNNVIAIFAGHLHNEFGYVGSVTVPGLPFKIGGSAAVPVFLSGSGECHSFLVSQFGGSYFNVGAVRSFGSTPQWSIAPDVCDATIAGYDANKGDPTPQTFTVTKDLPIQVNGTATATFGFGVLDGSINDPGREITVTADWGDGASDTATLPATPGVATFHLQHLYAQDGKYTVKLTAKDGLAGSGSATLQLAPDRTPPVTRLVVTGTNPPVVTLIATDNVSGVAVTRYSIGAGASQIYTGPFTTSAGQTINFWSTDNADNTELRKSVVIKP